MTCYNCDNKIEEGDFYTVFKNPVTDVEVVICEDCVENAHLFHKEGEE